MTIIRLFYQTIIQTEITKEEAELNAKLLVLKEKEYELKEIIAALKNKKRALVNNLKYNNLMVNAIKHNYINLTYCTILVFWC